MCLRCVKPILLECSQGISFTPRFAVSANLQSLLGQRTWGPVPFRGFYFLFWIPLSCLAPWTFPNSGNYKYFLRINHLQCHGNAADTEQRMGDVNIWNSAVFTREGFLEGAEGKIKCHKFHEQQSRTSWCFPNQSLSRWVLGQEQDFFIAVKDFLRNSFRENPPEGQTEAGAAPPVVLWS